MDTATRYRAFAAFEVREHSPCYAAWADGIAADAALIAMIDRLPYADRQPNLVFAAARYLGAAAVPFGEFRDWLHTNWAAVADLAGSRTTQTNEVGRMAVLLPVLAALPGPLALIEVGASAGLCLLPDLFSYRYGDGPPLDPPTGPSPVTLRCAVSGPVPLPLRVPEIVSRIGVDLDPLDVRDPEQVRWLEALVWPEQAERRARLHAAVALARADPPPLVRGDLVDEVAALVEQAPAGATVVVFHSAVLAYLSEQRRVEFERVVAALPCRWVANEGVGVVASAVAALPRPIEETRGRLVVTLDGRPLAYAGAHGQSLEWID